MKYFTLIIVILILFTVLCIAIDITAETETLSSYCRSIACGNMTLLITLFIVEIYLKKIREKAEINIARKRNEIQVSNAIKTLNVASNNLLISLKDLMSENLTDFTENSIDLEYSNLQFMYNPSMIVGYGLLNSKIQNYNLQFKVFQQRLNQIIILIDFSRHKELYDILFELYLYNENNGRVIDTFIESKETIIESKTIELLKTQTETPRSDDYRVFLGLSGVLFNLIEFNTLEIIKIRSYKLT
ncbi:hypothetical protein [Flavobacterium sp. NKUCC04_CG]|uniref:hypothetical protein n=1 Tax=Flavobacterium sp. NKUCC04_CG TaxID=2842121 RepID=UPI001C5A7BEC|nr:hypothetical protein [Flavobacterium sp. NKUCC04_CG]MBW3519509.1 hypothetical protein [Flavobacterium sp. NKUCC04_CG]